jgi:hypothetical protein
MSSSIINDTFSTMKSTLFDDTLHYSDKKRTLTAQLQPTIGLARERWNVLKAEREQSGDLGAFYDKQMAYLDSVRNKSNARAIEIVTTIFLNIR